MEKYAKTASKPAAWLETAVPEGLTMFSLPAAHRTRLRTVNALERLNQEIRRRTRVVGVFPNEASCLRLVSALAMGDAHSLAYGQVVRLCLVCGGSQSPADHERDGGRGCWALLVCHALDG